jgi:hypothetical protein
VRVRSLGALSVGILLLPITTFAQAPPRDRVAAEAPTGTARLEQLGKRFTLKEGETLELDVPYVE